MQQMNDFSFKHSDQIDDMYSQYTATQIKTLFDSRGVALRNFINDLIDLLNSNQGAANISLTPIIDFNGNNVQAVFQSIHDILKSVTDSNSGADFIGATTISGVNGTTVQAILEGLKSYIDTHKTSGDHDSRYAQKSELLQNIGATMIKTANGDDIETALGKKVQQNGDFTGTWNGVHFDNTQIAVNSELAGARHDNINNTDYVNLGARLDNAASQLNDIVLNVKNFGANGGGVVDTNATSINNAINSISSGTVYVPDGTYIITSPIVLKSNICLKLSQNAIIINKANSTHKHMIEVGGVNSGINNVKIEGGTFDGNYRNGTFKGNAIYLLEVNGITVRDINIKNTGEWGIKHHGCDGFLFENINFDQAEGYGINSDGITGSSINGIIRNIDGYTNDDMIGIGSRLYSPSDEAGSILTTKAYLTKNVIIENIRPKIKTGGTRGTHIAIGLYAFQNQTTENVTIKSVIGTTDEVPIRICDYGKYGGTTPSSVSYIKGIKISDINVTNNIGSVYAAGIAINSINIDDLVVDGVKFNFLTNSCVLTTTDATINKLIINNVNANPHTTDGIKGNRVIDLINSTINYISASNINCDVSVGSIPGIVIEITTTVNQLDIMNFLINYTGATNISASVLDGGILKQLNISNMTIKSIIGTSPVFYKKVSSDVANTTKVNVNNLSNKPNDNTSSNIQIDSGKVAVNGLDAVCDKIKLTPANGNIVTDKTNGNPCIYLSGAWKTFSLA